jgi:hypothetical protein
MCSCDVNDIRIISVNIFIRVSRWPPEEPHKFEGSLPAQYPCSAHGQHITLLSPTVPVYLTSQTAPGAAKCHVQAYAIVAGWTTVEDCLTGILPTGIVCVRVCVCFVSARAESHWSSPCGSGHMVVNALPRQ